MSSVTSDVKFLTYSTFTYNEYNVIIITQIQEEIRSVTAMVIRNSTHLGHGFIVRVVHRVRPIYNDVTVPDLQSTCRQLPFGSGCRFVRIIFQKGKTTVFLVFLFCRSIDDYINQSLCSNRNMQS